MGIYHCSAKVISRSSGRSATAAAAYRAAEIILDERTGRVHDYTAKRGVIATEIIKPSGQSVPDWFFDRERLWNEAERAEKRINSRVAREFEIALPHELDNAARLQLTQEFAQFLADRYQTAVDLALHAPDRNSDQRNHHAHILMSTRVIGEHGFEAKTRVLDSIHAGPLEIETIRATWAEYLNRAYERAGLEVELDHRSYKRQGVEQEPGIHLGPEAHKIEMNGQNSDIGEHNRAIQNAAKSPLEFPVFSPAERKLLVTDLYEQSDTGKALEAALLEHGFILARGDRRDFVIVHQSGGEHSLTRSVNGVRVKQIREKCADIDRLQLPSVSEAHELWKQHERELAALHRLQEAREKIESERQKKQEEQKPESKFAKHSPEPEQPAPEPQKPAEEPSKDAATAPDWSREKEEAERLKQEQAAEIERIEKAKIDLKTEFEERRLRLQQEHNLRREQKLNQWQQEKNQAMRKFDKELDEWRKAEQAKYVTCTGEVLEKHEKIKELWDRALCRLNVENFKRRARKEKNREAYINGLAMRRRAGYSKSLEDKYAKEMQVLIKQERLELRTLANEYKLEERNLDAALEQQQQEQSIKQKEQPKAKTPTLDKLLAEQRDRRSRLEGEWREAKATHNKEREQYWRNWKADRLAEFKTLQDVVDRDKLLHEFYKSIQLQVNPKRTLTPAQETQLVEKQLTRLASKRLKDEQKKHGRDYYANRDKLSKLELKERLDLADRGGTDADAARESAMKKQREIEQAEARRLRRMREKERDERNRDDR